jgi:hypothetical protein
MQHGRSHDERAFKAAHPRSSNLPRDDDTDFEAMLAVAGRGGAAPPRPEPPAERKLAASRVAPARAPRRAPDRDPAPGLGEATMNLALALGRACYDSLRALWARFSPRTA